MKEREYPTPWTVKVSKLRPHPFDEKIVEIHSADGDTPFPWCAFDADGRSFAKRVRLARLVAAAVNDLHIRGIKPDALATTMPPCAAKEQG